MRVCAPGEVLSVQKKRVTLQSVCGNIAREGFCRCRHGHVPLRSALGAPASSSAAGWDTSQKAGDAGHVSEGNAEDANSQSHTQRTVTLCQLLSLRTLECMWLHAHGQ